MVSSLRGGQWEDNDANGTNLDPSSSLLLLLFAREQDTGMAPIFPHGASWGVSSMGMRNLEKTGQADINTDKVKGVLRVMLWDHQ